MINKKYNVEIILHDEVFEGVKYFSKNLFF